MSASQIEAIRSFNRFLTRRIGALDEGFLGRGRPLAQARLLYEIGQAGADVRSLRTQLGLDSAYLSRLIRSLEKERLITMQADERDARRRVVRLSKKGFTELSHYDRRSDEFARSVLTSLNGEQGAKLVAAMTEVHRLLRISSLSIAVAKPNEADSLWCLEQYYRELSQRFDAGFDPARSISATSAELRPPRGLFVLARSLGQPVGCGALKVKENGVGEIKRMWVDRSARGMGLGKQILQTLEKQASALGLCTIRLETNSSLKEAQQLYRRSGYREVKPFNDEPYAHHWFEKSVSPKRRRRVS